MKKFYFLIISLFMLINTAEAQEKVRFGVKAGINISDFTGNGYENFEKSDSRTSFHLGVLTELYLAPHWNFQPEFLYSEQGYFLKNSNSSESLELELSYLELPLLAEFGLLKNLHLQAGPQLGYLLNKDKLPENGENGTIFNYNSFDFSLIFGAEFEIRNFFIYGRYNPGINQIVNSSDVDTHNRVLQAGLGLKF